jgi:hypothetical protein
MRSDFPERNPALDHRHVVIGADEQIAWEKWD